MVTSQSPLEIHMKQLERQSFMILNLLLQSFDQKQAFPVGKTCPFMESIYQPFMYVFHL